jgi:peptide chain release factor 1
MFDRLEEVVRRHADLVAQQADPEVATSPSRSREVARKVAELEPLVAAYTALTAAERELAGAREVLAGSDEPEMTELARGEVAELEAHRDELVERLKVLLLPEEPNDLRNVILEVRAGTGGEEAALFAADLFRMYCRFAESRKWDVEIVNVNETEIGRAHV